MRKIILSKKEFSKILLTTTNINNLRKLSKMHKLSLEYIPIIVMKSALIDLFEDDSTSGALTATIIGKRNYNKIKPQTNFQKSVSKVDTPNTSKVTKKNKKMVGIQPTNLETSIRISGQKDLIGEVITITPYISQKKKMIIGASTKNKQDKNQPTEVQKKENSTIKASTKIINPTIKKQPDIKQSKSKMIDSNISKKVKPKEIINQNVKAKIGNSTIVKTNQPKTPKYKLQKKSSPNLAALFSITAASFLLAFTFGHKKLFSSVLVASSLAIIGFGMFANKSTKKDKQFVKKIAN